MDQENGAEWRSTYTRVLGESLNNYCDQNVVLIAEVTNVHPSGSSMEVKTTDNMSVTVLLPSNDNMDLPQGLVELRGTVVGAAALRCEDMVKFDTEPRDFDCETYSDTVRLILQGGTPWKRK